MLVRTTLKEMSVDTFLVSSMIRSNGVAFQVCFVMTFGKGITDRGKEGGFDGDAG